MNLLDIETDKVPKPIYLVWDIDFHPNLENFAYSIEISVDICRPFLDEEKRRKLASS